MVKDISRERVTYKFGKTSISIDDLIAILESKGGEKITATSGGVEFENLEDIITHKSLLVGKPSIYTTHANIYFDQMTPYVSPNSGGDNLTVAKSICEDLKSRRTFLDRFSDLKIMDLPYVILLNIFLFFNEEITSWLSFSKQTAFYISIIIMTYCGMVIVKYIWEGYSHFIRQTVYYRPSIGFFRRNIETIVVSSITGIIGVMIGTFGPHVIEKFSTLANVQN